MCEEVCGDVFTACDDGLWVVKEEAKHFGVTVVFDGRDGSGHGADAGCGLARVPDVLVDAAVEAAEESTTLHEPRRPRTCDHTSSPRRVQGRALAPRLAQRRYLQRRASTTPGYGFDVVQVVSVDIPEPSSSGLSGVQ
ncbi:MAG: hypothetical protein ABW328_06535 [Ilumatobacteraceae bacterium]